MARLIRRSALREVVAAPGKTWGGRAVRIFATVSWTLVVTRAGTIGNGGEILILGNNIGNFFIFLGLISAILATLAKA